MLKSNIYINKITNCCSYAEMSMALPVWQAPSLEDYDYKFASAPNWPVFLWLSELLKLVSVKVFQKMTNIYKVETPQQFLNAKKA